MQDSTQLEKQPVIKKPTTVHRDSFGLTMNRA